MTHPSIRLEGSLLSADILDAIERGEKSHQGARDFGLEGTAKVKDEIAEAWAAARTYWAAYQVRLGRLREGATGTSETRNLWMVPFLELLGYHLALTESETISGKTYRVSHRDATRDQLPVHLIGWNESLDRRSTTPGAPRMSPHGLVQEYLNLTEHLYGVVSNGRLLRLLRDSSRLVNLTFIEFDLERIFTEELFADFALLYRLLHATRLPVRQDAAGEAPIEIYHQDSLDSGSRIRDGLSAAVQSVILSLANGFLNHPDNKDLHALAEADTGGRFAMDFYAKLLRLVYRLLFLMVIEERGLVHVPGEPLNFLDHHIKCGNAIVGFTRREELDKGVPDEAFKTLPGDDKDIAAAFRKTNKSERLERVGGQKQLPLAPELQEKLDSILTRWREVSALPEHDPAEIEAKKLRYEAFNRKEAFILRQIAAIPIAQFYQPKTASNKASLVTDAGFLAYLAGRTPQGQATASAWALAARKRAFHWFLEFPEIIARGGFDCIVGNPPYLGGTHLSGTYGHPFCEYVRWEYAPTGLSDLVVFFVRRIFALLRPNGFTAFITTNSIKDGDIRKDGLEQVIAAGGTINMAVRGIKWPGVANLVVSLVSICKGPLGKRDCFLDGHVVPHISALFEDYEDAGMPQQLTDNVRQIFEGVKFHGDGFLLTHTEAEEMLVRESRLRNVIFPCLNGEELNNSPEQTPGRHIINFLDWPLEKAKSFGEAFERVLVCVKPYRDSQNDVGGREKWWQFLRPRMEMYSRIKGASRCFVAAATTKHLNFSAVDPNTVFTHALKVFTTDRWDHYAVVQSTIHEVWARKYSGALETRLRYSPSDCFETFAFPAGQWQHSNPDLAAIGEAYHEHRRKLMLRLWLGLTDIYNLFHTPDLAKRLEALFKRRMSNSGWRTEVPEEHRATAGTLTHEQARDGILRLRSLHVALDQAVLSAYGWHEPGPDGPAIALALDFQ